MSSVAALADIPSLVGRCKATLQAGQAELKSAYETNADAGALLHGRASLVDGVLCDLWRDIGMPAGTALAAVGGYGRGELFPASDVDLLILVPVGMDIHSEPRLEQLVGLLWDIGLDIGHSVRDVSGCLEEAERDITVKTTLLEARFLCGSRALFDKFEQRFLRYLDVKAFFKAKQLELQERYARYNDTPYSLEPNCKESPGGMRDLQAILWVARAAHLGTTWHDLADTVLVTAEEARQLARADEFLCHVRIRLHHLVRRREERLLFEHQEALAEAFAIKATHAKRASEVFMQRYYRNAKLVTQLNTLVLQNLFARIAHDGRTPPIVIDEHFQMARELLDIRDDDVFEREPRAILEAFLTMERRSELKGMTARTLRALWRARTRIDAAFRRDPANRALFLSLFQQQRGLVHELRRMNKYDILGHYIPAFGRIVGQMQHDLFHVYTVDQHILQVVRNLRRYTMPEFAHEYPFCSRLITGYERYWLLYIAALFHDIAKGRGGDHSKLGVADARRFCRDHGIVGEDADLVAFLVEHHLTMSAVAQKQDLSDPDVMLAFAAVVKTERRLTALYLLTVSDIRGTSPKVWNAWKGKLLEDLYRATLRVLRGDQPQQAIGLQERQDEARRMLRLRGLRPEVETPLWRQLDVVYFMRHDAEEVTWHTRNLYYRPDTEEPVVKARLNPFGEGLQVMIYVPDQQLLFARLCGFFARLGYSIVDAKIHTTQHGRALDSFVLLDPGGQLPYRDMIGLIEHDLVEQLKTQPPLAALPASRLPRQVRHFPFTPEVGIRADERGQHYVMSVTAADRPGLLYAIARVLGDHGVILHTAKIATLGDRVEDTFLISGRELAQTATLVRLEQDLLQVLQLP
ncbi:MAG: [protein-PII] uridylyltransferase [Rhodocyclales bacterium GWA2_65_20]|nr:MAG: [protein-PII] uridylyltransferase [Rhodocyclales bacterium GWA2_65_20]